MSSINGQPNQVSSFQLKVSYWYVTHKLQLKKGLVIFLIVISALLYGYSLYRISMILLVEDKGFKQDLYYLSADLINYPYFRQTNKAQKLQILSFTSTDGREGRYDYVAKIKNPNPDLVAHNVVLQLVSGNEVIAEKKTFIYPQEEKYVAIFGQEISSGSSPFLSIAQVGWQRYRHFAKLAADRLRFEISDIKFESAQDLKIKGKLPVSTLSFKIKNNSGYSYWQVGVWMVLLDGQGVAGANYLALDQFVAGETRDIEMRWYESLPAAIKVEILPEVDILNADSYMPVK